MRKIGHKPNGDYGRFVVRAPSAVKFNRPMKRNKSARIVYGTVRGIHHRGLKKRRKK